MLQLNLFSPERLPHHPFCTNQHGPGLKNKIRNVDNALRYRYIQPNAPTVIWRLVFDIDFAGAAYAWEVAGLPPFNWAATNPENGHAHGSYEIEIPVNLLDKTTKAARLLVALETAFGNRLKADPSYNGITCKNPICSDWKVVEFRETPYSLTELAEWVGPELSARKPAKRKGAIELDPDSDIYSLGRNAGTFEHLRKWAYKAVREYWFPGGHDAWQRAVREQIDVLWSADNINWATKDHEYTSNERKDTAKSVATWVWENLTPAGWRDFVNNTHTPAIQSARGKKSGQVRLGMNADKRAKAALWHADGITQVAIAAELGVSRETIRRWLNAT